MAQKEVSERGGNRSGGRAGHMAIARRRAVLALKSTQMLTLERLDTSQPIEHLTAAEQSLKEALSHLAQDDG